MPMMKAALALLLALAACAPAGPARVTIPRDAGPDAPRGAALLRTAALDVHNRARAAVGVAPLVWDDTLAAHAAAYARVLAETGVMRHADQPQGGAHEGENLFSGTAGAYRYDEMVALWVDERRQFVNRPTPDFSTTGRWQDVAHYTQIVWRGTARVGCALATGQRDDFLVCRYAPAGNVVGQKAY